MYTVYDFSHNHRLRNVIKINPQVSIGCEKYEINETQDLMVYSIGLLYIKFTYGQQNTQESAMLFMFVKNS